MKKLFIVLLAIVFSVNINAENKDVQLIAVHIGSHEHMSVLDKSAFPDFEFYYNDAKLIWYSEQQKMMGNPKYLIGYYGEVPEKMGFCANYRGSLGKGYSFPYAQGAIYVIDKEGTIGYHLQPERFTKDYHRDTYYRIVSEIHGLVKKFKKGKNYKKLKDSKQKYLKKSAIGELEQNKGASLDKKNEGLRGWQIPDLIIKNEQVESKSLRKLTKGKITVLVFFSLNSAHHIKANARGIVEKEWEGQKLISVKDYAEKQEKKFMEGDYENKAQAKKGFAKTLFKSAVATSDNSIAKLIINNKEELANADKVKAYQQMVQHLMMIQKEAKKLKK